LGIPQKALSEIFEPFRQVGDAQTRRHGGSGLGLSIVRTLVQLMGGQIGVTSKVNVGSTFTITLPLVIAKEELTHERNS
jgi:two-component system, sensor histidine kinase and response regulator